MTLESDIVYKLENINKGLKALNQTVTQLKGVAYIGDDKRTKAACGNAIELSEAIGKEVEDLKTLDIVDETIMKEVKERLLTLLREASLNIDDKPAGQLPRI